jgi:hypothetical protein
MDLRKPFPSALRKKPIGWLQNGSGGTAHVPRPRSKAFNFEFQGELCSLRGVSIAAKLLVVLGEFSPCASARGPLLYLNSACGDETAPETLIDRRESS